MKLVKFAVRHSTTYRYSKPVFLEPHIIRLRPRSDPAQREISWNLTIEPEPARLGWALDAEGNSVAYAWFNDLTETLHITSCFAAGTFRKNVFDFLWMDESDQLGFQYRDRPALKRFLAPAARHTALTQEILAASEGHTADFLNTLNHRINESMKVVIRETGDAHAPEETLRLGEGACRDLTVLFVACCREAGLAARFVSGYQAGDPDSDERHLHAWAEVYLPGGGWRGFDPTLGLAVADQHIAVAAAPTPAGAAAISGSFRGTGATMEMDTALQLEAVAEL